MARVETHSDSSGSRRRAGRISTFVLESLASVVIELVTIGVPLFLPAGTLGWWRAWVLLGVVVAGTAATMAGIATSDPGLIRERFKPPIQKGQPLADRIVLVSLVAAFYGLILFASLDVFRLHLIARPGPIVSSAGLALFLVGWWIAALSLKENAYAAPVVRHHEERGQTVVDTGPYGIVRHPMYAGAVLVVIGLPLWLESYAATLMASVPIGLLLLRIRVEERLLRRELEGYDAYTERVRRRLIPHLW